MKDVIEFLSSITEETLPKVSKRAIMKFADTSTACMKDGSVSLEQAEKLRKTLRNLNSVIGDFAEQYEEEFELCYRAAALDLLANILHGNIDYMEQVEDYQRILKDSIYRAIISLVYQHKNIEANRILDLLRGTPQPTFKMALDELEHKKVLRSLPFPSHENRCIDFNNRIYYFSYDFSYFLVNNGGAELLEQWNKEVKSGT